jgi:hypothetical protein
VPDAINAEAETQGHHPPEKENDDGSSIIDENQSSGEDGDMASKPPPMTRVKLAKLSPSIRLRGLAKDKGIRSFVEASHGAQYRLSILSYG